VGLGQALKKAATGAVAPGNADLIQEPGEPEVADAEPMPARLMPQGSGEIGLPEPVANRSAMNQSTLGLAMSRPTLGPNRLRRLADGSGELWSPRATVARELRSLSRQRDDCAPDDQAHRGKGAERNCRPVECLVRLTRCRIPKSLKALIHFSVAVLPYLLLFEDGLLNLLNVGIEAVQFRIAGKENVFAFNYPAFASS